MKKKLKDIAIIRSGIFCQTVPYGNIRLLQSTDYDAEGELKPVTSLTSMIDWDSKIGKHILKNNDILFSAKGVNNYSVVFRQEDYECIASSSFFVFTIIDTELLLPEYLCWFLNNPETMKAVKSGSKGSAIPSITKSVIAELEIVIPSIEKQQTLVEIDLLLRQEYDIQTQLNLLKKQLLIKSIN